MTTAATTDPDTSVPTFEGATDATTEALGAALAARSHLEAAEAAEGVAREAYYGSIRHAIDTLRAEGVDAAQQRVADALGLSRSRVSELARRA